MLNEDKKFFSNVLRKCLFILFLTMFILKKTHKKLFFEHLLKLQDYYMESNQLNQVCYHVYEFKRLLSIYQLSIQENRKSTLDSACSQYVELLKQQIINLDAFQNEFEIYQEIYKENVVKIVALFCFIKQRIYSL